jgi:hypothetical protein
MSTKLDIANAAIAHCGESPINAFTDKKKAAELVANGYEPVRKEVLRRHPWKSVSDRKRLTPEVGKPVFGKQNSFILPSDVLRVWRVVDLEGVRPNNIPDFVTLDDTWKREKNKVLSDCSDIGIEYVADEENTQKYDDMLIEAIALKLAFRICYALTQDKDLKKDLLSYFTEILVKAKSVDAKESAPRQLRADGWIQASRTFIPVPAIPGLQ